MVVHRRTRKGKRSQKPRLRSTTSKRHRSSSKPTRKTLKRRHGGGKRSRSSSSQSRSKTQRNRKGKQSPTSSSSSSLSSTQEDPLAYPEPDVVQTYDNLEDLDEHLSGYIMFVQEIAPDGIGPDDENSVGYINALRDILIMNQNLLEEQGVEHQLLQDVISSLTIHIVNYQNGITEWFTNTTQLIQQLFSIQQHINSIVEDDDIPQQMPSSSGSYHSSDASIQPINYDFSDLSD